MPNILDEPTYPFHLEEARQLHRILATLYPTVAFAISLAEQAGVQVIMINQIQSPYLVWREILIQAKNDSVFKKLVELVNEKLHKDHKYKPFFISILANQTPTLEPEQQKHGAHSTFDNISEPESLLYHDDLTLQIGRVPQLIKTLTNLVALAPSVCRLTIDINGVTQYGTAFRIGKSTLLTNWHVLHQAKTGIKATAVTAEFGYEDNGKGGVKAVTNIACNVSSIVANEENDWAVIKTKKALKPEWKIINLSKGAKPKLEDSAFIVQHPMGGRKRIGFVRNTICYFDANVVHYLTDTQEGSSGSPVFNSEGVIIALHHYGGTPQEVVGKAPVKKNEGIRITKVLQGITASGYDLS